MTQADRHAPATMSPSPRAIQATFLLGFVSTAIHYWHNFVHAEHYPPVIFFPTPLAYQIGIVIFWPTLTIWGAWATLRYGKGHSSTPVLAALASWALLGFTSPGHFLGGVPDIPAYAMFTISTDFAVGAVMLVLIAQAWAARTRV